MKISIIGAGNMGGAMARGLSQGQLFKAADIAVSDISTANLDAI
ncbi:MAG: NAD(P)-binding domain-containing protein, partial [Bacteroidales bacterium]|nr:NAD(P)-binding domain-containing protein [Bacteroidales bacterium]